MEEDINPIITELEISKLIRTVIKNILDGVIPAAVKRRLRKPLLPGKPQPSRPPRSRKERKRKTIVEEFDPYPVKRRTDELVFTQTPWVIGKYLRGLQMDVPEGHSFSADPKTFLEGVRTQIHRKLVEKILALNGVKFQIARNIQLRKNNSDGSEE